VRGSSSSRQRARRAFRRRTSSRSRGSAEKGARGTGCSLSLVPLLGLAAVSSVAVRVPGPHGSRARDVRRRRQRDRRPLRGRARRAASFAATRIRESLRRCARHRPQRRRPQTNLSAPSRASRRSGALSARSAEWSALPAAVPTCGVGAGSSPLKSRGRRPISPV
jgi:hypothetical protein